MNYQLYYLASTYGSGAYDASVYNGTTTSNTGSTTTTVDTTTPATAGGILTNTGFDIAVTVTIASVILFVALIIRAWKRPTPVEVRADD